jgi:predicted nucleic acid-binding Zn ribbon protein
MGVFSERAGVFEPHRHCIVNPAHAGPPGESALLR